MFTELIGRESLFLHWNSLQMLLLMDIERVRAASLRALRYAIHRPIILEKFFQYHLDYLVCR